MGVTQASRKRSPERALPARPSATGRGADTQPPARAERQDDVVLVHGASDDGAYRVLRKRGEQLFVGEMRPVEEGKPLVPGGEVVALRPRADSPQLFDAETLFRVPGGSAAVSASAAHEPAGAPSAAPEPTTVGGGPAQVSTPAYREGWSAIFGPRRRPRGPHSLN